MPSILSASLAAYLNGLFSAAGTGIAILNNTPVYVTNPLARIVFYRNSAMTDEMGSVEDDPSRPSTKAAYDACVSNGVTSGAFAAEGYNGGGGGGNDNPQN